MNRKTTSLEGWSWFKFNNLGLTLGMVLKFYTIVAKELKLKVKKFWGLIPTFEEVSGETLVGASLSPNLNRVKRYPWWVPIGLKSVPIKDVFTWFCENPLKPSLAAVPFAIPGSIHTHTFDRFAPYKQKKVRYNNNPFMTKQLRKEIMVRSKLRNEFNKSRTSENWKKYKQQRNKCLSILKGTKTNYFNNLNPKVITDNKKFWSAVKPLFSDKSKAMNTIVYMKMEK